MGLSKMLSKVSELFSTFIEAMQSAKAARAKYYVKYYGGGWE
jgi:hypothetical protein